MGTPEPKKKDVEQVPHDRSDESQSALLSPTQAADAAGRAKAQDRMSTGRVCGLLVLQALILAGAMLAYYAMLLLPHQRELEEEVQTLAQRNDWINQRAELLEAQVKELNATRTGPYEAITLSSGHELPPMYGKVREKTIWAYWYHPKHCPSSANCVLPPHIQLCKESVQQNKGSFDYKIVHMDEVRLYVNRLELPIRWMDLKPAQQKDSLMNALLARYGGVSLDISVLLLRPLDDYWDEMVAKGASFRGYMYRVNGHPWRHAEVTVVWFLMARREGIFSTAVRNQVIGMGDRADTGAFRQWYLALGDQTLLPILSMYDYSLPKCYEDVTVKKHWACPEHEQPLWNKGVTGPARNDTKLLLRDPREGPQLPFAWLKMATWNISSKIPHVWYDHPVGAPMHGCTCTTEKECWEDVVLRRFHAKAKDGEARLLSFVKLFAHGTELSKKSRLELLSENHTYFYNWLKLAGLPMEHLRKSAGRERKPAAASIVG